MLEQSTKMMAAGSAESGSEFVEFFLDGLSSSSAYAYRHDLLRLGSFHGLHDLDALFLAITASRATTLNYISDYSSAVARAGLGSAGIYRTVGTVRGLLKHAWICRRIKWQLELISYSPAHLEESAQGYLKLHEFYRSIAGLKSLQFAAISSLVWDAQVRLGEVVLLDVEDVDFESNIIMLRDPFGRWATPLSLSDHCAEHLAAWISARGNTSGPLFVELVHGHQGPRLSSMSLSKTLSVGLSCIGIIDSVSRWARCKAVRKI